MLIRELVTYYLNEEIDHLAEATARSEHTSGRHIIEHLGDIAIADLTPLAVRRFHRALKRTPRTANLALGVLSKLCRFSEVLGERPSESNPCAPLRHYPGSARERFFTVEELRALLLAADWLESQFNLPDTGGGLSSSTADLFRFLIYSGARVGEGKSLRRHEVDIERKLIILDRTKTTQHTCQIRPLADAAVTVLRRRLDAAPGEWLFPGRRTGAPLREHKNAWRKLCAAADVAYAPVHVTRHSFASTAALLGFPFEKLGACLGHKSFTSTARYVHLRPPDCHDVANGVADALARRTA